MPQAKSCKFVAPLIEFSVLITLARKEMKDEMRDDTSRDEVFMYFLYVLSVLSFLDIIFAVKVCSSWTREILSFLKYNVCFLELVKKFLFSKIKCK